MSFEPPLKIMFFSRVPYFFSIALLVSSLPQISSILAPSLYYPTWMRNVNLSVTAQSLYRDPEVSHTVRIRLRSSNVRENNEASVKTSFWLHINPTISKYWLTGTLLVQYVRHFRLQLASTALGMSQQLVYLTSEVKAVISAVITIPSKTEMLAATLLKANTTRKIICFGKEEAVTAQARLWKRNEKTREHIRRKLFRFICISSFSLEFLIFIFSGYFSSTPTIFFAFSSLAKVNDSRRVWMKRSDTSIFRKYSREDELVKSKIIRRWIRQPNRSRR